MAGTGGAGIDGNQQHRRGRWADETPPCDRMQEDDDSAYADDDACWEEDADEGAEEYEASNAWEHQPSVEELKARWLHECRAVKTLEKVEKGTDAPSAALSAARGARDAAEQEWRDRLAPKPVSLRLGYAQRKLDKAQRALDKASQDLQQFEDEVKLRRDQLWEAVATAEGRRDARQEELDALHREAGELAGDRDRAKSHSGGNKVSDMVAKELQAIVELLEEGSEARGRANLLIARVATTTECEEHERFCIHTDAEDARSDADEGYQLVTRRTRGSQRNHAKGEANKEYIWGADAQGRWSRRKGAKDGDAREATAATGKDGMGKGGDGAAAASSNAPQDTRTPGLSASAHQPPAANDARGRKNAREEDGPQHSHPCGKSHRGEDDMRDVSVEADGDDAARAAQLKLEQDAAVAAAKEAGATFGDNASIQIAGQLYARKVQQVADRARAAGVEPVSDGRALIELAPHDLNDWIKTVLNPAEKEAAEVKDL